MIIYKKILLQLINNLLDFYHNNHNKIYLNMLMKLIQMVKNILEKKEMVKKKEEVVYIIKKEVIMMVIGKMIKLMDKVI